ncbi:MAG: hypothetical protein V3V16_08830 [Melioribacteraceae bacterium]
MPKDYKYKIKELSSPSFQEIRKVANKSISHLSKEERDLLWKKLKRGVALLDSNELMCQYLFSFGNMHQAKIQDAVSRLPKEIFENDFEIIDWGCGQGIGTVCFFDYLKSQGFKNNVIRTTLIEPSEQALERAHLHVSTYLNDDSTILTIPKFLDDVTNEDIKQKEVPVIHFFSNILDIPQIDLKLLATKIDKSVINDNYIVSVGPLNSTNHRIDAFYKYYKVPILYDYENRQFDYGGYSTCTYKAKIYKLEFNKEGNLIPIEFYPSVQFHSSYQLDNVNNVHIKSSTDEIKSIATILNSFETSTPFDIGASVYDDIHPILAVLNNIITRGLPTKASPLIENIFRKTFEYSKKLVKYGTFSYPNTKDIDYEKILLWYNSIITNQTKLDYSKVNKEQLQLIFSPLAIARVQKAILEALMTNKLDITSKEWEILIEEKDVPCSAIAFADLSQMFNNLTKLSKEYHNLTFPKIDLSIISNEYFVNSKLHLDNNVSQNIKPKMSIAKYDLVIDISVFETSNISKDSFSKFKCKNNCYFNIRSTTRINSERNIAFQMPMYPMIDDRLITNSAKNMEAPALNSKSLDPLKDETISYIQALKDVKIPVIFKLYEGCFHGFEDVVPQADISKDAINFTFQFFAVYYDRFVLESKD